MSGATKTRISESDVDNLVADLASKAVTPIHEADVTGLVADLAGKSPVGHGHVEADIAGLVADLAGKSAVGHGHVEGDVANLVADLAGKAPIGAWTDVAYNAGDFTASGAGGWQVEVGDLPVFSYYTNGKLMQLLLTIQTSSVTAPLGNYLYIKIPNSKTLSRSVFNVIYVSDNGTANCSAIAYGSVGDNKITIQKVPIANWAASVNNTAILLSMTLPIN